MPTPSDGLPADPVHIRLLGRFAVEIAGAERPAGDWLAKRAAELVQVLALQPERRLLNEQVVEALWPRLEADAGGPNVRKAAHHARQSLGEADAVVLQRGSVALFPRREVTVDAQRFERDADAALAAADPAACAAAARLWTGDLLPEARYAAWSEAPRERLRGKLLKLLRVAGDFERLVQEEPADEAAYQALMRRALAEGSRATALRWYSELRAQLAQALAVRPSAESEALYRECLSGLHPAAPVLVGRGAEVARAVAALRRSAADRPGGLVVSAAAGMGKTSFCRRVADDARELGWCVFIADAADAGRAYGLLADLIEPLLLEDRGLLAAIGPHAHGVLAALTPVAGPAPPLPGPLSRHQVVGALRRLLLAAARQRPALVVADDIHLADDGSVETLLQLAAGGPPVFVMLASRPRAGDAFAAAVARMLRHQRLLAIELGPLAASDAAGLAAAAAALESEPLPAAVIDRIVELAEGLPFAIVELARSVPAGAKAGPLKLPASGLSAIAQRLVDVDEPSLAALRRLAIAGGEFDAATALTLAADPQGAPAKDGQGNGGAEAAARLDRALVDGLLTVVDGRYRFRHALVRTALVDGLPPHRRRTLHAEAARALALAGAAPGLVAGHWLDAGEPLEALPFALRAARAAHRLSAFADVLRIVEPVLAHVEAHPELLGLKAEAIDALGRPGALAAYDAAAAVAGEAEAHELRAKRALAQVKMSDPQGALKYLETVRPTTVAGRLAEALAYSGAAALGYGDPANGSRRAAESRRLALETGDVGSLVIASWAQAAAAHARGDLHGSVWADLHETSQMPHLAVRVFDGHLCITQRFLYGSRPYADVIAFADSLAGEAQRLGAARGHAFAVTLRGEAKLLSGHLDAAEEDLLAGGRLHHAIGGATGEALALQRRAELAMYRGQRELAGALLDDALDVARQSDVGFHLLDRIYGTRIQIARHPDAALAALEEADDAVRGPLETCPGCRITFAVPATIAAARARELEIAAGHERQAEYLANVVMRLPAWHAALHEARAHIAQASGDRDAATRGFSAAAQGFSGAGHPLDAARCEQHAAGRQPG